MGMECAIKTENKDATEQTGKEAVRNYYTNIHHRLTEQSPQYPVLHAPAPTINQKAWAIRRTLFAKNNI
jgi:hypothetical protein